ncbi:hypothetical protein G3T14_19590 [Methylobacterium sp. BTF04]|uniref:hypothetical protein n=1 Tax=Methylobacterium sp. BTF04 TaxID=2708300 RepID=UPI0013D7AB0B|nr:hypothetical protein [Methylobacterium sp. BTF04]NEU14313.1 hypothetical protein [Methylobacterium sp. BTF04]
MMHRLAALLALTLTLVAPARAFDLQSTPVPGRTVTTLTNGEIAINRADRKGFFKNVDGSIGSFDLLSASPGGRKAVVDGDASGLVLGPGGPLLPAALAGKASTAGGTFTGPARFGASIQPYASNAIATTGSASLGSTSMIVSSTVGVNIGDPIIVDGGVPFDTQVAAILGNTVTMTEPAYAAYENAPVRFGLDRWDLNAHVLTNTLGAQNVYIGAAAQGRGTWLSQVGSGGADYGQVSALQIINPLGGMGFSVGGRMSDENTGLKALYGGQILIDVDVNPATTAFPRGKPSWGLYHQAILRPGTIGGHLAVENSIASFQATADVDPWNVNPINRVVNYRVDAGIGPDPQGLNRSIFRTPNPISAYFDMVNNGAPARNGFNVGVLALDTLAGRVAPFASLPPNVSLTWYSQAGTRAWDITSTVSGVTTLKAINLRASDVLVNADWSLSGANGSSRGYNLMTDGSVRWQIGKTATVDGSSNSGSDFAIAAFDNVGAYTGIPLLIRRSDGLVQMPKVAVSGGSIDGTAIGATAPSPGAFTGLAAATATVAGDATVAGAVLPSVSPSLAAAGTTQATATAIVSGITIVTSGTGGIVLRNKIGERQEVFNRSGAALNVYPTSGARIEAMTINAAALIPSAGHAVFVCVAAAQCYQAL